MADKCNMRYDENGEKMVCKEEVYIKIKVRVFHPTTNRKTWQSWKLCKHHFHEFLTRNGEGYYCFYPRKPFKGECPVIDFQVPTC